MRIRHLTLATFLIGSCVFTTAVKAIENEEGADEGRVAFVYGGECNQLAKFSRLEIQAITHAVHADTFDRFCFVEGVYSCSDYTAMLRGVGTLEANDTFGCNFVPTKR